MMHATLHIISRAMFSSDSDDIVDLVEHGVNQYQTNVRPQPARSAHFPVLVRASCRAACEDADIFDEFDHKVDRLLIERGRRPDAEPKDPLARLIAARDSDTGSG